MLARITVALFFLLLIWGNLVSGLKAGLACPDWPLCQGRILPPLRLDIWMEFTHRLIAAVATLSLLFLAWKRLKIYDGFIRTIPVAAVVLIAVEIALGGLTVIMELPARITTIHFMTGLAVFLLAGFMAVFDGTGNPPRFAAEGYTMLFLGLTILIFFQASIGAYVRHSGAGLACPDFPTCLGSWLPHLEGTVLVQYSHRLMAFLLLATIAALSAAVFIEKRLKKRRMAMLTLLILGIVQTGIGAGVVQSNLNFAAVALHLALALIMLLIAGRIWIGEAAAEKG